MSVLGGLFGGGDSSPVSKVVKSASSVTSRAADFALREQQAGQRAAAAGASRSDNDADLLGATPPKKRSSSRELLG